MSLLRRLLIGLSRKAHVLPNTLFVQGVECKDRHAIAGGGYADIFRGRFGSQSVALKRLRTFATDSATDETKNVSS